MTIKEFMIVVKPITVYITKEKQCEEVEKLKQVFKLSEEGRYVVAFEIKYSETTPRQLVEHVLNLVKQQFEVIKIEEEETTLKIRVKPVKVA